MKSNIPLLLSILFLFIACEKEDLGNLQNNSVQHYTSAIKNSDQNPNKGNYNKLKNALEWTAFITGKILNDPNNTQERMFIISQLNGGVISLEDIIGENINPAGLGFKNNFITLFNNYHTIGIPGDDEDTPNPPFCAFCDNIITNDNETNSLKPSIPTRDNLPSNNLFPYFQNYLLNENCTELYFPVGLTFLNGNAVTTLSHPLSNAQGNIGILIEDPLNDPDDYTVSVFVSQQYLLNNENVIVARPVRVLSNPYCTYTKYSGIDFTDFLD